MYIMSIDKLDYPNDWRRSLTKIIIYFDELSATGLWSSTGT